MNYQAVIKTLAVHYSPPEERPHLLRAMLRSNGDIVISKQVGHEATYLYSIDIATISAEYATGLWEALPNIPNDVIEAPTT